MTSVVERCVKGQVTGHRVIKLPPVITLDNPDGASKLSGNPIEEVREHGERIRIQAQGKSPQERRVIMQNEQVVSITSNVENRGCPHIIVNQVKIVYYSRRGRGKRKPNMST
jgi:hypothetical protein